jgi:hypothetical protein|tara:strand:- start:439 stop:747 length:309 start_codon:yes stop_codon:yes gene_type:complete
LPSLFDARVPTSTRPASTRPATRSPIRHEAKVSSHLLPLPKVLGRVAAVTAKIKVALHTAERIFGIDRGIEPAQKARCDQPSPSEARHAVDVEYLPMPHAID